MADEPTTTIDEMDPDLVMIDMRAAERLPKSAVAALLGGGWTAMLIWVRPGDPEGVNGPLAVRRQDPALWERIDAKLRAQRAAQDGEP